MKNNKVVYAYFDKEECFYIGIGEPDRSYRIKRNKRNKFTYNKIKKAKKDDSFSIQILHTGLTWEIACWYEVSYIRSIGRRDLGLGTLTNLTDGGEGTQGYSHTKETRKKISQSNTGKTFTNEARKRMSEAQKGKCLTKETKEKLRQRFTGRVFSDESKKKMSISQRGRVFSDSHKRNISKAKTGKGNPNSKTIITPLGEFESCSLAAKAHGVAHSTMSKKAHSKDIKDVYFKI